ncbi:MAG: phage portal protein, partial [Oscillospiraceae bacterium]|nr:phage portal protein [Oscillospiraceae bacterium]
MSKKRNRARYGRDAPQKREALVGSTGIALTSPDAWKVLCGDGYRPIMKCPEVQMCINVYADLISSMTLR